MKKDLLGSLNIHVRKSLIPTRQIIIIKTFEISGAILVRILLFWKKIFKIFQDLHNVFSKNFRLKIWAYFGPNTSFRGIINHFFDTVWRSFLALIQSGSTKTIFWPQILWRFPPKNRSWNNGNFDFLPNISIEQERVMVIARYLWQVRCPKSPFKDWIPLI